MLFVDDAKNPHERGMLINECNRFDITDLKSFPYSSRLVQIFENPKVRLLYKSNVCLKKSRSMNSLHT